MSVDIKRSEKGAMATNAFAENRPFDFQRPNNHSNNARVVIMPSRWPTNAQTPAPAHAKPIAIVPATSDAAKLIFDKRSKRNSRVKMVF